MKRGQSWTAEGGVRYGSSMALYDVSLPTPPAPAAELHLSILQL